MDFCNSSNNNNSTKVDSSAADQLIWQIHLLDKKYNSVSEQLALINVQLDAVKVRHERARAARNMCFRFQSRLRLVTLQHVAHAYWHYMSEAAEQLDTLQAELINEHNIDWETLVFC